MITFTQLLTEAVISPTTEPDHASFWHGGDLTMVRDDFSPRHGRFEYGPGLYLTTHYNVAKRYAKGSRKLYLVTVKLGTDIRDATIPLDAIRRFVAQYVMGKHRNGIMARIARWTKENQTVPAYVVVNSILNPDRGGGYRATPAMTATNLKHLRQFAVTHGVDYELVQDASGTMMVLYNTHLIVNIRRVLPTDTIEEFDLPKVSPR